MPSLSYFGHSQAATPDESDEVDESLVDEFSPYGRDPFEVCALIEEELGQPLKEPMKKQQ